MCEAPKKICHLPLWASGGCGKIWTVKSKHLAYCIYFKGTYMYMALLSPVLKGTYMYRALLSPVLKQN